MSTTPTGWPALDPSAWQAGFPTYQEFQRFQAGNAALSVEAEVTDINRVLKQLAGLHALSQRALVEVGLELLRRIALKTPVKTGRLRNSFHLVPPGQPDAYVYQDDIGSTFEGTLHETPGPMEALVGTNVVYAVAIEGGHSRQAPQGMVAISVAEMRGALDAKLDQLIRDAAGAD